MTEQLQRFINLLKGIFELDKSDLDFGIYRIMNIRKAEIERFLTEGLPRKVQEALAPFARNTGEIEKEITSIEKQCEEFGIEVMQSKKAERYAELKKQLALGVDLSGLEADVYSNLYSFFNRYYEEGDFISKRRYKEGVYAIPYEGEEVKLYWANQDQYYIKTSENFRDYTFVAGGYDIHFRLVDATTEQNNNKESADSKRVFMLFEENDEQPELKTFEFNVEKHELIIRFVFDVPPDKKFNYAEDNAKKIHSWIISDCNQLMTTLLVDVSKDPKKKQTLIEKHLAAYTAKNTFDYFIHKDLRGFLSRELDFYIKNEVIHLDDVDTADEKSADIWLAKVRAIKRVGRILIDFLAQIEDFQKKLWLKKKFVLSTDYCITLDKVPEKFYSEIFGNAAQVGEWEKLGIFEPRKEWKKSEENSLLSVPSEVNPYLMVDTKFFDADFKARLLAEFDDLDAQTDGLLIHSENFQALNLLQERYREQIKCIYIDPPYNTGGDGFIYRDNYQHSSWLSMTIERIKIASKLMHVQGVFFTSIDENEVNVYSIVCKEIFPYSLGIIAVKNNPKGRIFDKYFSTSHEYLLSFSVSELSGMLVHTKTDEEIRKDYPLIDERGRYRLLELRNTHREFGKFNRPKLFYPLYVRSNNNVTLTSSPDSTIVLPLWDDGFEGCWTWGIELAGREISKLITKEINGKIKIYRKAYAKDDNGNDAVKQVKTVWDDKKYQTDKGQITLTNLFGDRLFASPKPPDYILDIVKLISFDNSCTVLDYFAGSGTTAHAVINLNREDGGKRKYILVEMGDHFGNVLKPRIEKVVFAKDWKDGKPVSCPQTTPKSTKNLQQSDDFFALSDESTKSTTFSVNTEGCNRFNGVSQMVKYLTLESYEDALSNISLLPDEESNQMTMKFGDEYLIKYMLDLESRGSVLNLEAFRDPFDYQLNVTEKNETKRVTVDVVETFNYLIGLTVTHMSARKIFRATPDQEGEYEGAVKLALDDNGKYCFRQVEGKLPDGRRTLVIWRNVTDNLAESNAALDAYFTRNRINPADREYDVIYVNGDNNLENLRTDHESWKVRLIEIEFKQKMFEEA